jgi:hypothetical protein
MKKVDSMLLKMFLYGLPFVIVFAIFAYLFSEGMIHRDVNYLVLLNNIAGIMIALWMALSLYLSVRLLASGTFRDHVITRMTFMKEHDEREALLTGKATKATFLTTLAILIFLFCLSCFQVSVYRMPPEKAVNGKTGMLSLGLGFSLLEQDKRESLKEAIQNEHIFSYRGLPISSETIILLLIIWQIASYNYSMRRLMK